MTDDKLQNDITRGHQAKALMDSDIFKDAFAYLDNELVQKWKATPEPAERETAWHSINALVKVREHFEKIVSDGKVAQRRLDEMTARNKR